MNDPPTRTSHAVNRERAWSDQRVEPPDHSRELILLAVPPMTRGHLHAKDEPKLENADRRNQAGPTCSRNSTVSFRSPPHLAGVKWNRLLPAFLRSNPSWSRPPCLSESSRLSYGRNRAAW